MPANVNKDRLPELGLSGLYKGEQTILGPCLSCDNPNCDGARVVLYMHRGICREQTEEYLLSKDYPQELVNALIKHYQISEELRAKGLDDLILPFIVVLKLTEALSALTSLDFSAIIMGEADFSNISADFDPNVMDFDGIDLSLFNLDEIDFSPLDFGSGDDFGPDFGGSDAYAD